MFKYKSKLLKVIDGDTMDFMLNLGFNVWEEIRVQLIGINTPKSYTKDLEEKVLGLEAKQLSKDILENAKEIYVKIIKIDKFGRYLAEVYTDGKKLTKQLLKIGLAREYHGEKKEGWFKNKTN